MSKEFRKTLSQENKIALINNTIFCVGEKSYDYVSLTEELNSDPTFIFNLIEDRFTILAPKGYIVYSHVESDLPKAYFALSPENILLGKEPEYKGVANGLVLNCSELAASCNVRPIYDESEHISFIEAFTESKKERIKAYVIDGSFIVFNIDQYFIDKYTNKGGKIAAGTCIPFELVEDYVFMMLKKNVTAILF